MNREILFKAKTTKKNNSNHEFNEKWVEGDLIKSKGKCYIHPTGNNVSVIRELGQIIIMHEIDSNTLCQYTGLTDKNGERIWENDIVKHEGSQCFGVVKWYCGEYVGWCVADIHDGEQQFTEEMWNECEVIGNIFDNHDWLEVK